MSYLALARKWRPRTFSELVGQEHVVKALSNSLSMQRVHHAWLFTGTRGVGKTTLARIMAKSLNCETGITATPCGKCSACIEIDQGRFVDYIEVDAASKRKVDEITPLLEQAIYAPARGRFKIYTIDEVHMLTGHAFNAMLKTLEEPPPHLKFILATTDPQKIPVTVLSRCIQYNLKQIAPDRVVAHLQSILDKEGIQYEDAGLRLIAQGAAGSMRDALSLTDQAIAFSGGNITLQSMQDMLGSIDQSYLIHLLHALLQGDASAILELGKALNDKGYSYEGALSDLAHLLSQIAIEQRIAGTLSSTEPLYEQMVELAKVFPADLLQLFYSIAIHARTELAQSPDEYAGFMMACLRMLSLVKPLELGESLKKPSPSLSMGQAEREEASVAGQAEVSKQASVESQPVVSKEASVESQPATSQTVAHQVAETVASIELSQSEVSKQAGVESQPATSQIATHQEVPVQTQSSFSRDASDQGTKSSHEAPPIDETYYPVEPIDDALLNEIDEAPPTTEPETTEWIPAIPQIQRYTLADLDKTLWVSLVRELPLKGMSALIAQMSEWIKTQGNCVYLRLKLKQGDSLNVKDDLSATLTEYFGQVTKVEFVYGETNATAFAQIQEEQRLRQEKAVQTVQADPFVQAMMTHFHAQIVPHSIKAI